MFPVSTIMAGMATTMGPTDVCKTPTPAGPIPMPYMNLAQLPMTMLPAYTVMILKMPALNLGSMVPMSNGDEPGVAGGVVSGLFMGPCSFKTGSIKVFAQGLPIVRLTSVTGQNGSCPNTPGMVTVPSQAMVFVWS